MEVARVIASPPSTLWELLAQPGRWPEWGPSVRDVECSDVEVRAGTQGRVRTPIGVWLPFTVTAVDSGRTWRWRVVGVPATGHRIEPIDEDHARVVFEIPGWALPYALVCHVALRNLARLAGDSRAAPQHVAEAIESPHDPGTSAEPPHQATQIIGEVLAEIDTDT